MPNPSCCHCDDERQSSGDDRVGNNSVQKRLHKAADRCVNSGPAWPAAIADKGLGLLCYMRPGDERLVDNRSFRDRRDRCLLFLPDGRIAEYEHAEAENGQLPRTPGVTSDDEVLTRCNFHGEPRILVSGIDWPGTTARLRGIHLVQLQNANPPAENTPVPVLSPSVFLERYETFFSTGGVQTRSALLPREDVFAFRTDSPDWQITIPDWQVRQTIALMTESDHPDASQGRVAVGMMVFLRADSDSDGSLSEEEVERSSRTHRITFSEFPVEQKTFLDAYLESRSTRSGNAGSRSR